MLEKRVGIRELKQNASAVVATSKAGYSVVVTDRGVPVARLIPFTENTVDDAIAMGLATQPTQSLAEMVEGIPDESPTSVLSDTLARLREDNRA